MMASAYVHACMCAFVKCMCACAVHAFNLCNEVNHIKTSQDRFREVTYIPAISVMRPNILGLQVTTVDRFHCNCIVAWLTVPTRSLVTWTDLFRCMGASTCRERQRECVHLFMSTAHSERTWCVGRACSMHRPCVLCLLKLFQLEFLCCVYVCTYVWYSVGWGCAQSRSDDSHVHTPCPELHVMMQAVYFAYSTTFKFSRPPAPFC